MSVAIHIEADADDADALKKLAAGWAKGLGDQARHATFSTTDGTTDLLAEEAIEAETIDGKKVRVKNPAAFAQPVPKTIEYRAFRATGDFAKEHGFEDGDWVAEDPKKQRRYLKATPAQIAGTAEDQTVAPDIRAMARDHVRAARRKGARA